MASTSINSSLLVTEPFQAQVDQARERDLQQLKVVRIASGIFFSIGFLAFGSALLLVPLGVAPITFVKIGGPLVAAAAALLTLGMVVYLSHPKSIFEAQKAFAEAKRAQKALNQNRGGDQEKKLNEALVHLYCTKEICSALQKNLTPRSLDHRKYTRALIEDLNSRYLGNPYTLALIRDIEAFLRADQRFAPPPQPGSSHPIALATSIVTAIVTPIHVDSPRPPPYNPHA